MPQNDCLSLLLQLYQSSSQSTAVSSQFEAFLLVVQVDTLANLNFCQSLSLKHVIKVRLASHMVKAHHLIDVAHPESLLLLQDGEEGKRDNDCPNDQGDTPQQLDEELMCITSGHEPTLLVEQSNGERPPQSLDPKDQEGLLWIIDLCSDEYLASNRVPNDSEKRDDKSLPYFDLVASCGDGDCTTQHGVRGEIAAEIPSYSNGVENIPGKDEDQAACGAGHDGDHDDLLRGIHTVV